MNALPAKAAYAADPAAITAVGTDAWSAEFGLAATGAEFEAIIDAVLARYHAAAAEFQRDQDSRRELTWTLALPIIFSLSRIVHAELAAERLRQQGRLCRFGDEVLAPDALVSRAAIELDWLSRSGFNRTLAPRTRARLFATGIAAGFRGVLSPSGIGYSVMRPRFRMLRAYAAENAIHDRPLVLQPVPATKAADPLLVDAALSCVVAGRTAAGVIQADPGLQDTIRKFFRQIETVFDAASKIARGRAIRPLLIASIRSMADRAMAVAWRGAGGQVICFTHGNIHATAYRRGALTDGSAAFASRYVAGSRMEATISGAAVRDFGLGKVPEIVRLSRNMYADAATSPAIRNATVRRIMLVGAPLTGRFYPYTAGTNAFSVLDLELRLCALLKIEGFHLTYKAHPETLRETKGVFDRYVDTVETGRFEQLGPVADCLVFSNWYSSTFGHALMSDWPIVLLRDPSLPILDETARDLESRCVVVNAVHDERGRIQFDRTALLAAIDAATGKAPLPGPWWAD
jgi:hypothetical protein